MRIESLMARVEFNERRVRTIEGAAIRPTPEARFEPAARPVHSERDARFDDAAVSPPDHAIASPGAGASSGGAATTGTPQGDGSGQRSRRRRRRRGRRGGGQPGMMGGGQPQAAGQGESSPAAAASSNAPSPLSDAAGDTNGADDDFDNDGPQPDSPDSDASDPDQ
jgi:hypothetical protein